jgi:phage shock protein A
MAREVTVNAADRITELREINVDALLGSAEATSELLDFTVAQQQELLGAVWSAITDVAAGRKRARTRESRLRRSADRLQRQAGQAAAAGRAEYARQAMAWRTTILHHVTELATEQAALRTSEERLATTARRLQASIEASRVHRETINAGYTAARSAGLGQPFRGNAREPAPRGTALNTSQLDTSQTRARLEVINRRSAVEKAMAQIEERRPAR